jgi:hypothetical protein
MNNYKMSNDYNKLWDIINKKVIVVGYIYLHQDKQVCQIKIVDNLFVISSRKYKSCDKLDFIFFVKNCKSLQLEYIDIKD